MIDFQFQSCEFKTITVVVIFCISMLLPFVTCSSFHDNEACCQWKQTSLSESPVRDVEKTVAVTVFAPLLVSERRVALTEIYFQSPLCGGLKLFSEAPCGGLRLFAQAPCVVWERKGALTDIVCSSSPPPLPCGGHSLDYGPWEKNSPNASYSLS